MCDFQFQHSDGLPYAKVVPPLWIGSTMFSLSGGCPSQSQAAREANGESSRPLIYHGPALLCQCARSRYNGPTLCVTRAHFRPFKLCFSGGRGSRPSPNLHLRGRCTVVVQWDETCAGAPFFYGTLTLAKNIMVNSVISVWRVWKNKKLT